MTDTIWAVVYDGGDGEDWLWLAGFEFTNKEYRATWQGDGTILLWCPWETYSFREKKNDS